MGATGARPPSLRTWLTCALPPPVCVCSELVVWAAGAEAARALALPRGFAGEQAPFVEVMACGEGGEGACALVVDAAGQAFFWADIDSPRGCAEGRLLAAAAAGDRPMAMCAAIAPLATAGARGAPAAVEALVALHSGSVLKVHASAVAGTVTAVPSAPIGAQGDAAPGVGAGGLLSMFRGAGVAAAASEAAQRAAPAIDAFWAAGREGSEAIVLTEDDLEAWSLEAGATGGATPCWRVPLRRLLRQATGANEVVPVAAAAGSAPEVVVVLAAAPGTAAAGQAVAAPSVDLSLHTIACSGAPRVLGSSLRLPTTDILHGWVGTGRPPLSLAVGAAPGGSVLVMSPASSVALAGKGHTDVLLTMHAHLATGRLLAAAPGAGAPAMVGGGTELPTHWLAVSDISGVCRIAFQPDTAWGEHTTGMEDVGLWKASAAQADVPMEEAATKGAEEAADIAQGAAPAVTATGRNPAAERALRAALEECGPPGTATFASSARAVSSRLRGVGVLEARGADSPIVVLSAAALDALPKHWGVSGPFAEMPAERTRMLDAHGQAGAAGHDDGTAAAFEAAHVEDKRARHAALVAFVEASGLDGQLDVHARFLLAEHAELIAAALAVRACAARASGAASSSLRAAIDAAGLELVEAAGGGLAGRSGSEAFYSHLTRAAPAFFRAAADGCGRAVRSAGGGGTAAGAAWDVVEALSEGCLSAAAAAASATEKAKRRGAAAARAPLGERHWIADESACASLEACLAAIARMERPLRAERPTAITRLRGQLLQAAGYALAARAEALAAAAEVGEADALESGHAAYKAARDLALGSFSEAGPAGAADAAGGGVGTPLGVRPMAADEGPDARGSGLLGMAEEGAAGAARLLGESPLAKELEAPLALAQAHRAHAQLLVICDALEAAGAGGRARMYALMASGRAADWEAAAARHCPRAADGAFADFCFARLRAQGRREELLGLPQGLADPFALYLKSVGDADLGWVYGVHRGRTDEAAEWLRRVADSERDEPKRRRVLALARLAAAAGGQALPLRAAAPPAAATVGGDLALGAQLVIAADCSR